MPKTSGWARETETAAERGAIGITVVFTNWSGTAAALRTSAALARGWKAHITIFAAQVVPWPAELDSAGAAARHQGERLHAMALQCATSTSVNVYVCRDCLETLLLYVPQDRIVVMGARRRPWRTKEEKLARAMRRAGYEVIVAEER